MFGKAEKGGAWVHVGARAREILLYNNIML